ncbi:hypothetical protein CFC21_008321 [Triticum aestivum]|uniref:F-box domain-containing protein n=2 Tax=Triticum aestivum TaxID=4565 RepID=A0A9R1ISQ9_WHEAT|nr:hypothetical protein CFC21_008315 [Triticum aestivum]KAF6991211.1 hypothetical protein CFC21_008321 [Triticum aestivum]
MEPSWERSEGASVKKPMAPPAPPTDALGDDLLGEILRRLPDMASLASAALVCKGWDGVASDPVIFRRFLSLRAPLLVGVILTKRDRECAAHRNDLRFVRASSTRNPKLASAAAHGDFYFEGHPEIEATDRWSLRGCNGGLLLLCRGRYALNLAVYDPLERTAIFFEPPAGWHMVRYAIVGDEAGPSFQVIAICPWHSHRFAVFSSGAGKWVVVNSFRDSWICADDGMAAGRFAYLRSNTKKNTMNENEEKIYVLDTKTMVWSVITAPFPAGESYYVADMAEHGGLCIVSSREQCVLLWVRDVNGGWVVKKEVSLLNQFRFLKRIRRDEWMKRLRILAMKAGYVYMEFWSIRKSESYILVLNLNTVKLQQFFRNNADERYRGAAFPFFLRFSPLPAADDDKELQDA